MNEKRWHPCPDCGEDTWAEDLCCCCSGLHMVQGAGGGEHGVYSIDTHGEGWDLMPVDIETVELGGRVMSEFNKELLDKVQVQRNQMVVKLVRFAQQVEKWVEWHDLGLSTKDELIEDVRVELANLSLAYKKITED